MCDMYVLCFQGPKEIVADSRISFDHTEQEVVLNCTKAVKADEGNYSVTLRNPKGSDTCRVHVIVVGNYYLPSLQQF